MKSPACFPAAVTLTFLSLSPVAWAAGCESLASVSIPHTTVTKTELVSAGAFPALPDSPAKAVPRASTICLHSAAFRRSQGPPAIPRLRSKSGCPRPTGTASCGERGTAASAAGPV